MSCSTIVTKVKPEIYNDTSSISNDDDNYRENKEIRDEEEKNMETLNDWIVKHRFSHHFQRFRHYLPLDGILKTPFYLVWEYWVQLNFIC